MPLPRLREELDLLAGPAMPDGQPSWTLHDPVRNLFFRIDWPTLEILQRWGMDDPAQIAASVAKDTTLSMQGDDVLQVAQFLVQHQLVQAAYAEAPQKMAEQLAHMQGSALKWLLHHYLFQGSTAQTRRLAQSLAAHRTLVCPACIRVGNRWGFRAGTDPGCTPLGCFQCLTG